MLNATLFQTTVAFVSCGNRFAVFQLCLFLVIIVLLFFIQIVYNLETEAVIH